MQLCEQKTWNQRYQPRQGRQRPKTRTNARVPTRKLLMLEPSRNTWDYLEFEQLTLNKSLRNSSKMLGAKMEKLQINIPLKFSSLLRTLTHTTHPKLPTNAPTYGG